MIGLAGVEPADRRRAWLALTLFASLMASYYVFKSVRDSLFLHYESAQNLAYAHIGSMVVAGLSMAVYNRVLVRYGGRTLLRATVWVLFATGLAFFPAWMLVGDEPPLVLVYAFFFYVSLYGVLAATVFWTAANDSFDTTVGRKVYGFIGIGGFVGSFSAGTLTSFLITQVKFLTEWMMPVGAALVFASLPLMTRLFAASPRRDVSQAENAQPQKRKRHDGLYHIVTDPYVALMAGLVVMMTFVGTLFDLQYKEIISAALTGKEAKTVYFSLVFAGISLLGALIQLFVTGPVHRRLGAMAGLVVLPVVGIVATFILFVFPNLYAIAAMSIVGGATVYSINQASKELLYIPTPEAVRYGSKGFIDVFGFRAGDGLGSSVALLLTKVLKLATSSLAWVCVAAIPLWALILVGLRKRYRERLDTASGAS